MSPSLSIVGPRRVGAELPANLLAVLERFVSPSSAQAMVRNAMSKAERMGDTSPSGLLPGLVSTAKILIPPGQREAALEAIRAELGANASPVAPAASDDETVVVIRKESDVSPCRMVAREACKGVGVHGYRAQKVVTAVSELARNIAHYAGEGRVRLRVDANAEMIHVVAEDQGPGIEDLDRILAGDYRSPTGLGRGLIGVHRLSDNFKVETGSWGTRVSVGFHYGAYSS